jgi:hypothetical protein
MLGHETGEPTSRPRGEGLEGLSDFINSKVLPHKDVLEDRQRI